MATPPKDGKLLYHLTSIDNLEGILKNGLLCRNSIAKFDDIADSEIIEHRKKYGLNDLVPFHFFAPSPLHGVVQKVYKDKRFCYITVHRRTAKNNKYKILKKHPLSLTDSKPLSYEEGIETIEWEKMAERNYTNHECKEICLAECLAQNCVKHSDFFSIIVKNQQDKKDVQEIISKTLGNEFSFHIDVQIFIFTK